MQYIVSYAILIAAIYCSFKLAKEKSQHHIVWPLLTAFVGPLVFIVQYLATTFIKKEVL